MSAAPCRLHSRPRPFYRAAKLGIRGEKAPVTQAKRLRVAADTPLISAL
jgi:hypothetical protein